MNRVCRHFGECGGCSFQDIPYSEQVLRKKERLIEVSGFDEADIIPSEKLIGFRNKMEFSFEGESLGLHPKGRFSRVVDLSECPVFSGWVGDFLEKVREFASEKSLSFYRKKEKKGLLRYLILRESKFTGQKMAVLVVDGTDFSEEKEWGEAARSAVDGMESVILARRHTSGDSALTEDYEVVSGSEYIEMKIGHTTLDISPYSFFQPNSFQVENLYSLVSSRLEDNCSILDLYSGIGSIPFYLAAPGRDITGVESYPVCNRDARRNLKKIKPPGTVRFIQEGVKKFVSSMDREYDYIIVDPPRGGMSYRIWKHINRFSETSERLKKIFYICCSLKNLKTDMSYIRENTDWKLIRVTGVDQFVHTPHLETVVEYAV